MVFESPRLVLSVDFPDANNLLAGVLNLKGFRVFKSKSTKECLSILNQSEEKLDIVLISTSNQRMKTTFFLLNEINRITRDAMIVVIVSTDNDQQKLRKNAVEFILRLTSAENLADKILNMLAKKELKEAQILSATPEYEITFN